MSEPPLDPPETPEIEEKIAEWLDDCPVTLDRHSIMRDQLFAMIMDEYEIRRTEP